MIAALFVETNGVYSSVANVDPWDVERDARLYDGPFPVVAHPPCERWGRFWHGSTRKPHQFKLGDDGGCFLSALNSVRSFGGVLEHPADSHAWRTFGLSRPLRGQGWVKADAHGGWTCYVEQGHYGHISRKPTWLYAVGTHLPELNWSRLPQRLHPLMFGEIRLCESQAHRRRRHDRRQAQERDSQRHAGRVSRRADQDGRESQAGVCARSALLGNSQIMISSDKTVGPVNPDVTYVFVKQCISRARRAVSDNMCMPYQRVIMYLANRVAELEAELAKERGPKSGETGSEFAARVAQPGKSSRGLSRLVAGSNPAARHQSKD